MRNDPEAAKASLVVLEMMMDKLNQLPITADGEYIVPGMIVFVESHDRSGDTELYYKSLEVWGIASGTPFGDGKFTIDCEGNDYGEKCLYSSWQNVPGVEVHPKLRE